jgi:hypothetical protein
MNNTAFYSKLGVIVARALRFARDMLLRRRNAILAHEPGLRFPSVPSVIVPDLPVTESDVVLADRLLAAYRESVKQAPLHGGIWGVIRDRQSTFIGLLEGSDPRALATYLGGMNRHDATIGTVQGIYEYDKIVANRSYRNFIALQARDKLVSLAEAVGALPCENPEQGPWGESLAIDTATLVGKIEQALDRPLTPPDIDGGLLKILSSRGLFNERDANAIYTAWLIENVFAATGFGAIAEIGAGVGRVAHWCTQFGCRSYTVFDLPHINVLQGYYLQKGNPDRAVVLYGEPRQKEAITVLPFTEFANVQPGSFDLILNQDSFPEMEADVVMSYLKRVKINSSRYFLSLNHESRPRSFGPDLQISVPEMVARAEGYRLLSRQLYWLRKGYVSELYAVGDAALRPQ